MFESMIERIAREYLVVRVSWRNVKGGFLKNVVGGVGGNVHILSRNVFN